MKDKIDRRDFVKMAGVADTVVATSAWTPASAFGQSLAPGPDAAELELVSRALDAAESAGADYADVRITHSDRENIDTRERQIIGVSKTESYGIGIRALVGGSWGLAGTRDLSPDSVTRTAREAVRIARPVTNFRFNQSITQMLSNIEVIGIPRRVASGEGSYGPPIVVPPLKVRDFNLASVSDTI